MILAISTKEILKELLKRRFLHYYIGSYILVLTNVYNCYKPAILLIIFT